MPKRSRTLGACAILVFLIASSLSASAGLFSYRLIGGVNAREFWIDPGLINPDYAGPIRNAVASWNNTPTSVRFAETSNNGISESDFYARDYGPTGWRGATVMRDANGNGVVSCGGCAPFANWVYSEISLNDAYLRFDCCFTEWQNTSAHEFGHSIALSHSSLATALMYFSIDNYVTYGIFTPQQHDDIDFASQLD